MWKCQLSCLPKQILKHQSFSKKENVSLKTFERENKKRKTKSKLFLQLVPKHCQLTYFNDTADLI